MPKCVLIINPEAGRGTAGQQVTQAARDRLGAEVWHTQEAGDAAKLAKKAVEQDVGLVLAAGGDGTISEAVNGLVRGCGGECGPEQIPSRLGVIPMGTANDFCRTVGMPADPLAAIEVAEQGEPQWIDLIRLTDQKTDGTPDHVRYLINAATGGFSRVAAEQMSDVTKGLWGPLAYLQAAVRTMHDIPEFRVRLWRDDQPEPEAVTTCAVIVANGRYAGGGMELVPDADPTDHRLDVLMVTAHTFFERLKLTGQFVLGEHLESEDVVYRAAKSVRLEAEPALRFSSDGEAVGQAPIRFEVAPSAVSLMLPVGAKVTSGGGG